MYLTKYKAALDCLAWIILYTNPFPHNRAPDKKEGRRTPSNFHCKLNWKACSQIKKRKNKRRRKTHDLKGRKEYGLIFFSFQKDVQHK